MLNETSPKRPRFFSDLAYLPAVLFARRGRRKGSRLRQRLARGARPWLDAASSRVSADVPLLEAALARVDPTLSLHRVLARVLSVRDETHDVRTYVLEPNARFGSFLPGSYVTLHLTIAGRPLQRSYSLSSAPSDDGKIAITVKRVPGGVVSNHVLDLLAPGQVVELSAPRGQFVLRRAGVEARSEGDRLLMISAGSGITPVMSMLRHLVAQGSASDITFLHFARTPADLIFRRELEQIAERAPNVKLVLSVEQPDDAWTGPSGRVERGIVEAAAPGFRTSDIYLCGPSGFMQSVMQLLERADADLSRLRFERFTSEFDASLFLEHTQTVRFLKSGVETLSNRPLTILEEAEAKGLVLNSGCRAGTCGTCRCKKKRGVVFNTATGQESNTGEEMIYPCVSIARGTVEVEL